MPLKNITICYNFIQYYEKDKSKERNLFFLFFAALHIFFFYYEHGLIWGDTY